MIVQSGSVQFGSAQSGSAEALGGVHFNVVGVLTRERYDELVAPAWRAAAFLPKACSALVLGNGGPGFFRAYRVTGLSRAAEAHPLDAFTRCAAGAVVESLRSAGFDSRPGFYFERRDGEFADFRALGQASGLGAPSRLGILLHPEFGPWMALRVLVLTEKVLNPTRLTDDFAPCRGCSAPCVDACPGTALSADARVSEAIDLGRCSSWRTDTGDCVSMCSARRACVVGPEWAYDDDAEAFHMASSLRAIARE